MYYFFLDNSGAVAHLCEARLQFSACQLHQLLPQLCQEGLHLLAPYIGPLYSCPVTGVGAAWHLTGSLAQAYGPKMAAR